MKKITTNQWLIGAGVIALIYILSNQVVMDFRPQLVSDLTLQIDHTIFGSIHLAI